MVFVVEAVVSALLSASLQVLFDRLSPRTNLIEFFRRHEFNEILLETLKTTLLQVNAILSDAEEKQITNFVVRQWVDELKDAAYHTADLLDEIHSLALAESQASSTSAPDKIIRKSKAKLEKMIKKLEIIAKHKDVLGLKESFSGKPSPRLQLTSLVDETEVYGRGNDKEKIMEFLLSGSIGGSEIPVVAIIGMAGVGKTTLAQLLYNDSRVKTRFRTRVWVHVSEDLDVFKVTKTIYESVTLQHCDITDLNILQVKLKKILTRKKFLIVLDDVWNEYYSKWDALRNFLKVGVSESRIIVTARSQGVASTMRTIHTFHLQPLEDEDCWLVFADHAFGSLDACTSLELKSIGQKIMKKCRGLPLAAKVLGSLLYSKVEVHEWINILDSHIWNLPNDKSDILPSLRLSYCYLSSHLKQCFAYCSIFPKGHLFNREKLIMLWMAEGFLLQPKSDRAMEEVGTEYFNELLSRSFFQQASDDDDNKSSFVMHDLINELAQFASSESCFKFEKGKSHSISEKARHFSYVRDQFDDGVELFDALNEAKFLRTFLPVNCSSSSGSCSISKTVVDEFLPRQKRLRVLSLSYYVNINRLPDKFGKLIHLRYLNLSYNAVEELPKSIGYLYNLQTLILSHCIQLVSLPASLQKLISLRHLDLNGTSSLRMMPLEFGRLTSLRILTTFVVSNSSRGSSIGELGPLLLLHGKLSILELQNVRNVEDAENATLKDKENVKELEFSWSSNGSLDGETIIEYLRPHENIGKLSIVGYGGTRLPDWLGDSSFSKLAILHVRDCRNCLSLSSLGRLPFLQELHVKNMLVLDSFQVEFYGNSCSSFVSFASLRILKFEDMPNWVHWSSMEVTGGVFPSLQELHIQKCQNLIEIPNCLSSLELLFINECWQLQFHDFMDYPALQTLHIESCNYPTNFSLNVFSKLKFLRIHNCRYLRFLEVSEGLHEEFLELEISECPNMELFSGRGLAAPNLTTFTVSNCNNLRSMPEKMHMLLSSLQTLNISCCPELVSFPDGCLPASLQTLAIKNCAKLRSMPEQMHILLSSLQTLNICSCPKLESFPDGGLPLSLQKLIIQDCVNLTPQNAWGLTNMASLSCLTIKCAHDNVTSFPDEGLLPVSLTSLHVSDFPVLKTLNLSGLHHLTLLEDLQINCHRLQNLSDGRLPSSLSSLSITGCSSLTDLCQKNQGIYWDKISHIPIKVINGNKIH